MGLQWHFFKTHCSQVASKRSQPEKSEGEVCRRSQPERTSRKSQPQRKTNHSVKSFKTLQQAAKLCRRQDGSRLQISCNVEAAPPECHIIHKQALFACEGCLWPQAVESAELQIRLTEVSGTGAGIYELRRLWACAAGSFAKGSPRARQTRELRPEILKPRRSRPAGSIGLRGGSYCRRASSARGWAERTANLLIPPYWV